MRAFLLLGLWVVGCQREADSAPPPTPVHAKVEVEQSPEPVKPVEPVKAVESTAEEDRALPVWIEDRGCTRDDECTAILTRCSMCEGACTGVRSDRAAGYAALDCSRYRGELCNYDCRPSFKIEAPRCVQGRCESVRIKR